MWMLISGQLLASRGALYPALQASGLEREAVRRAWAAFRYGVWQIVPLVRLWQSHVEGLEGWQYHVHEGYRAVSVDITAFFRPTLKGQKSKHYYPPAGKALPAVIMGLAGVTGSLNGQRLALPKEILRVAVDDPSEKGLQTALLERVARRLAEDEIAVLDAGFPLRQVQAAGIARYVVRLSKNFTARHNQVAPYSGHGRPPTYGEWVRPLARSYKGKKIAATAPDKVAEWEEDGRTLRAEIWCNLVLPGVVPDPDNPTFQVVAVYDPRYQEPWLLATNVSLQPVTVKALYQDRWPVEQIPLAAKHMVGAHRQFFFAEESRHRLPELALLASSIQSVLAATLPVRPTGFWDRNPKRTPGRLRRALFGQLFPSSIPLPERIRKKKSVTAHLPKGVAGHRRTAAQKTA
ncbi:MAG: hypothetical protein D6794_05835 [Deltaproteobacteria bacterium]|nr:MAG: hypothetical protein D6794_05835 [Deltaproteobacteria bacterium]